jgi:acetolactate synthase-1/2/3 large subunit
VLVGGGVWTAEAGRQLAAWAEASSLPACTSFRRQSYVDNRSPVYCGYAGVGMDSKLAERVRQCDVLLVLGARLGEATTGGYELVVPGGAGPRLIHVYPDASELGRVYRPELGIVARPTAFAAALAELAPIESSAWRRWTEEARSEYVLQLEPQPREGGVDLGAVTTTVRSRLSGDAILTNGAGNFAVWPQRYYVFSEYGTQLGPTSGAMGYGVPAAIAAKLRHPLRPVVCFAGDGDFLMTGQELATAVRQRAGIVVLVVNNGMYGTIRMHQERAFPGRVVGTSLVNPDFAALARAFGAHGEVVERTEQFADAFDRALAAGGPALLELRADPDAITPTSRLSEIREAIR